MSTPAHRSGDLYRSPMAGREPAQLADVLERVLDKGIVIAGDVEVRLLDIELLTLKLRLLIASADTAQAMGIDWWKSDPNLSSRARELTEENNELRERLERLEALLAGANGTAGRELGEEAGEHGGRAKA